MEVEDKIQLTDVAEVFIKHLDECMNHFKYNELIFVFVHNGDKIQGGVSFVHDFVLLVFDKVAGFGFTGDDELVDLD